VPEQFRGERGTVRHMDHHLSDEVWQKAQQRLTGSDTVQVHISVKLPALTKRLSAMPTSKEAVLPCRRRPPKGNMLPVLASVALCIEPGAIDSSGNSSYKVFR